MLSVAKCGYDNSYVEKYRNYHKQTDLDILQKHKTYITVAGGEHCGELYSMCVAILASLDDEKLVEYFTAIHDLFKTGNLKENLIKHKAIFEVAFSAFGLIIDTASQQEFYNSFMPLKAEIVEITEVMLSNYAIYVEKVWEDSKGEIITATDRLNEIFSQNSHADKWEQALDCKYPHQNFFVIICNSIQNGPQAIDISHNKDVFYLPNDYQEYDKFISHEFGIYIMKVVLSDTLAFRDLAYYKCTESLVEYFNRIISGSNNYCNWYDEYITFYTELRQLNPTITAKEMFLIAVKHFL